ncbi:acetyltransferase [candidate division WOR-3 bacterium]|uniref:Acetyltransferase n=1 Tax=candidate division WOR-3 bacterium TaxID=2052148 RepID=A0A937XFJ9_UNCW3|nr:acetyltransferase [candidate division WOR-3 bacterium]
MRVLIIGAGGHGQVVADILLRMSERTVAVEPIGFLDDNPALSGRQVLGLPVLGTTAAFASVAHDAFIVAIGDNATRRRITEPLLRSGERLATAQHPDAVIARDVSIGPGTTVCAGAVVNPGSVVGSCVLLNTGCSIDHHNLIGDYAHVAPGVRLGGQVVVGEGALVGIGAMVTPRLCIGAWCVVGAGSLVHHDVPSGVMVVGNPARVLDGPAEKDEM